MRMRGDSNGAGSQPRMKRPSWAFSRNLFTLLGVVPGRSGERVRPNLGENVAASSACQFLTQAFRASASSKLTRTCARVSGHACGLAENGLVARMGFRVSTPHNMSANTDAQVRPAAQRPVLGRRLPLR
jgi:hypothetical protein